MSGNHETIISAGNPVKRFPTGLQELYLDVCEDGQPPICHQRLTEKEFKVADQENRGCKKFCVYR